MAVKKALVLNNGEPQQLQAGDTLDGAAGGTYASYQAAPSDPSTTGSSGGLMMGLAGSITPTGSGKILIIISGSTDNSADASGTDISIRTGTGTAPTNGAALTGTVRGNTLSSNEGDANGIGVSYTPPRMPFSVQAVVTGLSLSTAYWVDISLAAISGGTARVRDISISVAELP